MKLPFTKMSGAGNDFVVIDNRKGGITDGPATAKKLCDRRWGIGADGLLLVESSAKANYRMMYYNADGSYGGMCGNGGRCIAFYTAVNKIAPVDQTFEALDFVYAAQVNGSIVKLKMKNPANIRPNIMLPAGKKKVKAYFIDTGSPHVVIQAKSISKKKNPLDELPVQKLGRGIRNQKLFQPSGTNVNFIEKVGANSIKMRTYERGVEAETLACGTGSIACAIVGSVLWKLIPPITVITRSQQELVVNFSNRANSIREVTLQGPATVVFEGSVEI